ncbi:MAG: hypothetical protein KBC64_05995 [Simkaniaceae bacterium]|nr:hypothetical protein [Simkaniaceae bacterium]
MTFSSFITTSHPDRFCGFGGTDPATTQSIYAEGSQRVISHAIEIIKSSVENTEDPKVLFPNLLKIMADMRREIADLCSTEDAEKFGKRRDDFGGQDLSKVLDITTSTELTTYTYYRYAEALSRSWNEKVPDFVSKEGNLLALDTAMSKFYLTSYPLQKIKELQWNIAPKDLTREVISHPVTSTDVSKTLVQSIHCDEAFSRKVRMANRIRRDYPITYILEEEVEEPGSLSSRVVCGQSFFKTSGGCLPLTESVISFQKNGALPKRTAVVLMHQHFSLIEPTLEKISEVFKRIIEWNKEDPQDLKKEVALFRYLFAHCCPFSRGSAAIGEWFEKTLYAYHGFTITHNPEKTGDLDALIALTFEAFFEVYPLTISTGLP